MNTISGTPDIIFPNIGIVIDRLNKVAFNFFGTAIYWYGIIMGIGVAAGLFMAIREAKRTGQSIDDYYDFLIVAIIASLIGARLYYVIFSWDTYKDDLLSIFNLRSGGIAIYGCIIGSVIAAIIFTKIKKINFFKFADTCVFGLILGQIIGRWGNFFNREAFGGYTNSIFAMQYLKPTVDSGHITQNILDNVVMINGAEYIQVHPTFLYECLWNIGLFIIMNLYKKNKKFDGEMLGIYFTGYAIGRFWIEGLRTDQLILFGTGLAASQVLSAILAVAGIIFIVYNRRKLKTA